MYGKQSPLDRKPLPGIATYSSPSIRNEDGKEEDASSEVAFGSEAHSASKTQNKPPLPERRSQSRGRHHRADSVTSSSDEESTSPEGNQLKEENNRLQRRIRQVQEDYETLQKENEDLHDQVKKVESKLRLKTQEQEQELSQMEMDNAAALRQLRDSNRESINNLQEEYEEKIREMESKHARKLKEAREETREEVCKETEQRIREELNSRIRSLETTNGELHDKVKNLEEENKRLQSRTSEDDDSKVNEVEKLREEAIQTKEKAQQEFLEQKKQLIEEYENHTSQLKKQLQQEKDNNKSLNQKLEESQNFVADKDSEIRNLKSKNYKFSQQLVEERDSYEKRINDMQTQQEQSRLNATQELEADIKRLQHQLSEQIRKLKDKESEIALYEERLEQSKRQQEQTRSDVNHELESEVKRLQDQVSQQSRQLEDKDEKIANLHRQNNHLDSLMKQYEASLSEENAGTNASSEEARQTRERVQKEKEELQKELDSAYEQYFKKIRALKATESDWNRGSPSSPVSGFSPALKRDTRQTRSLTSLYHEQKHGSYLDSAVREDSSTTQGHKYNINDQYLRQEVSRQLEKFHKNLKENIEEKFKDFSSRVVEKNLELRDAISTLRNVIENNSQVDIKRIESKLHNVANKTTALDDKLRQEEPNKLPNEKETTNYEKRIHDLMTGFEKLLAEHEQRASQTPLQLQQIHSSISRSLQDALGDIRAAGDLQSKQTQILDIVQHLHKGMHDLKVTFADTSKENLPENENLYQPGKRTVTTKSIHAEPDSRGDDPILISYLMTESLYIGWMSRYQLDENVAFMLSNYLSSLKRDLSQQRHKLLQDRELWKADARRLLRLKKRSYRVASSSPSPSSSGSLSSLASPSRPNTPAYRFLRPQKSQQKQKSALMEAKDVLDQQSENLNRKVREYRSAKSVIDEFHQALQEVYDYLQEMKQKMSQTMGDREIQKTVDTLNDLDSRFARKVKTLYKKSIKKRLPLEWPATYYRLQGISDGEAHTSACKAKEFSPHEETLSFQLSGSELSDLNNEVQDFDKRSKPPNSIVDKRNNRQHHTDKKYPHGPHFDDRNYAACGNRAVNPSARPPSTLDRPEPPHDTSGPQGAPRREGLQQKYRNWMAAAESHTNWLRTFRESIERSKADMQQRGSTTQTSSGPHDITPPPTTSTGSLDFVSPVTSLPDEVSFAQFSVSPTSTSINTAVSTEENRAS